MNIISKIIPAMKRIFWKGDVLIHKIHKMVLLTMGHSQEEGGGETNLYNYNLFMFIFYL